jgi:amphi-Trp domain-containing protein
VKKKEFEHDSLQDTETLVAYLKEVTRGFEEGKLSVSGRDGEINLEPRGMIRFELRVSERADRCRLNMRFTWKPEPEEEVDRQDDLKISSGSD